jgi:hypothetical protein
VAGDKIAPSQAVVVYTHATAFLERRMMKLITLIKEWLKREPVKGPAPGPVFNPIFRRMTDGPKVTEQVNIRR